ncbi:hydroxypyruvate isomerase family protein [Paenibacillus allorhizosphaerae]|uniref:Hydroxypyruvate isomerase n=1 Tax=Paenibacillus allorhizosphaerae TaxID=2849866 RepID=A0ABN7TAC7_9BACL|nr:TIM barrel protein [Paenibacillus allorhizosphaerae]CAG7616054.1 Hydroxypyruvate isomerase [Paenibacillus allorhizosphaerae]
MFKFAAHLEMNFSKGVTFKDRWLTANRLGFQGCEFVWRLHDLAEATGLKAQAPLAVSVLGGTTGGTVGGGRPVLVWPEDRERLAADVQTAVSYAGSLECPNLIMVVGNLINGWSIEQHRQEAVASLKSVAPILEQAGVTAVIEPLNSKVDHKGVYCDNTTEAFKIVEEVGSPNVKILYDAYHMQIMEGNVISTIRNHNEFIGYYHIAKVPGRVEPIGGELNFYAILEAVAGTGYEGFVGLEYKPSVSDVQSLEEVKRHYPEFF